jgi:8-oxo-dGTP diphosphatase
VVEAHPILDQRMSTLVVTAGVLINQGKVLLTQRKPGTHQALSWEFPGGKVEQGEDPRDALARELKEEIGILAVVGDVIDVTFHRYPDRSVLIVFYAVSLAPSSDAPQPVDIADMHWTAGHELGEMHLSPADRAVVHKVRRLLP